MALYTLLKANKLDFVVSQNVDGLHIRSGIPRTQLAELHGNCYVEYCHKCKTEYYRDFDVTTRPGTEHESIPDSAVPQSPHLTGRLCENAKCKGFLLDNIVGFGEFLPVLEYQKALEASESCDLAICMGSSLRVEPSCSLPLIAKQKNGAKIVIINLQKTPLDSKADIKFFSTCDDIMIGLIKELGLTVSKFGSTEFIEYGNTQLMKPELKFKHEWTFFIRGKPFWPVYFIEKVEILLPEGETNGGNTITLYKAPFELRRLTNQPFEIGATIHFKSELKKEPIKITHLLNFNSDTIDVLKVNFV